MDSGRLDHPAYGQLHELRKPNGYRRKDSKEVSETQLASTQGQNARSAQELQGDPEPPVTGTRRRGRPPEDVAEHLQGPTFVLDRR